MDEKNVDIGKAEFSKSLRGYSVSEVDKYVKTLTEAYSSLYRRNADLEKKLEDAEEKISELSKIKDTVEDAKRRSSDIVRDAYENADGILFSIKSNCDAILKSFRDKVAEQKRELEAARRNVELFQRELFEKYKIHIELIQNLTPAQDDGEILSANDYVERVVTNLKREIYAEYGISLESIEAPPGTDGAQNAWNERRGEAPALNVAASEDKEYVRVDSAEAPEKRRMSALEMLNEYEKRQAQTIEEDGIQLVLDIDAGTARPSEGGGEV